MPFFSSVRMAGWPSDLFFFACQGFHVVLDAAGADEIVVFVFDLLPVVGCPRTGSESEPLGDLFGLGRDVLIRGTGVVLFVLHVFFVLLLRFAQRVSLIRGIADGIGRVRQRFDFRLLHLAGTLVHGLLQRGGGIGYGGAGVRQIAVIDLLLRGAERVHGVGDGVLE